MMRETERFGVYAPDGTEHVAVCMQKEINTSTLAEGRLSRLGLPEYRLLDGRHLNTCDHSTFTLVDGTGPFTRTQALSTYGN